MKMTRVKFGDKGLLNFSIAPLSLKNIGYFLEFCTIRAKYWELNLSAFICCKIAHVKIAHLNLDYRGIIQKKRFRHNNNNIEILKAISY